MSHPVQLIVEDDLQRTRGTVFFRILLAIPHFAWLLIWGIGAFFAVIVNWLVTLIEGTPSQGVHAFLVRYLRYAIQVSAYLNLLANPYPAFSGDGAYPVDLAVAPPARQNRWTVAFRAVLVWPALLLGAALAGGIGEGQASRVGGLLVTIAVLGWFAAVVRGRMPRGLRDAGVYALTYSAQLSAYLLILTDRYPDSDPRAALADPPVRSDPIRVVELEDDLRRSRLTVFFRLLLSIPHLVWLSLWTVVALLAVIVSWFATLIMGRTPGWLHRFLAAFLRYQTHVYAFVYLVANPFPGFVGAAGSYPLNLVVEGPERQNRWGVAFRGLLAIPALLISSAYGGVMLTGAILGWFAALVRGRMPRGLRNAGALSLRYTQQANGYLYLLTSSYPYSGPTA